MTDDELEQSLRTDDNSYFLTSLAVSSGMRENLAVPLQADVAFLALGRFLWEPSGPTGQLDVELLATVYDGRTLTFKLGGGVSTRPPISGRGFGSDDDRHTVFASLVAAGINSRALASHSDASILSLRFEQGVLGVVSMVPDQLGVLRNSGSGNLLIFSIWKTGGQAAEFDLRVIWYSGAVWTFNEFAQRLPVELSPGESIFFGGRFFPGGEGQRTAEVRLTTNIGNAREIQIPVVGVTIQSLARGSLIGNAFLGCGSRPHR